MKHNKQLNYSGASAAPINVENARLTGTPLGAEAPKGASDDIEGSEAAMRQEQAAQMRSQANMATYGEMKSQSHMDAVVNRMIDTPPSPTDPNGSYTGKPMRRGEKPVQDADDL